MGVVEEGLRFRVWFQKSLVAVIGVVSNVVSEGA